VTAALPRATLFFAFSGSSPHCAAAAYPRWRFADVPQPRRPAPSAEAEQFSFIALVEHQQPLAPVRRGLR
jgi:hypothetical protein